MAILLAAREAAAEVYKCEDPEGGIVFQQTPCPEPEAEAPDEDADAPEEAADTTETRGSPDRPTVGRNERVEDVVAARQEERRLTEEVEACKQQYRDAIDAIDIEIQNSYAPEQKEYYLQRLKALTDKMSAC